MVRFKNRWFLIEFIDTSADTKPGSLDGKQVYHALRDSVVTHFGDCGWGAVGTSLTVKYFSPTTNLCIIRVARDHHRIAWGAITLVTGIDGVRVIPHVVHVAGTVKHAQLSAIAHNREVVARFRAKANTPALYRDGYDDYLDQSAREIEAMHD